MGLSTGQNFLWYFTSVKSREEVQRQFSKSFKNYPDTRVIIDATKFFIEKPTSPCAQKATWSDYKHHNTVKLLVGIAPIELLLSFPNCGLAVPATVRLCKKVVLLTSLKREII